MGDRDPSKAMPMADNIVDRLRSAAIAAERGEPLSIGWDLKWITLCTDAANEIELLRGVSGVVSPGPTFAEMVEGRGVRRVVMTGDGISIIHGDKRDA